MTVGPVVGALVALVGVAVAWRINPPRRRLLLDEIAIRDGVDDAALRARFNDLINKQAVVYLRRREDRFAAASTAGIVVWSVGALASLVLVVESAINGAGLFALLPVLGAVVNGAFLVHEVRDVRRRHQGR